MATRGRKTTHRWLVFAAIFVLISSLIPAPPAMAHAELREASPGIGQTVGGEFHAVILAFSELDPTAPQAARLFDPAGNRIESELVIDGGRLILPIEPLEAPGVYTVEFEVNGLDRDGTSEQKFTFTYDPQADEPGPITFGVVPDPGFDWVNFALLLVGAAIAAFLAQRVMSAWRDHKAAQRPGTAQ